MTKAIVSCTADRTDGPDFVGRSDLLGEFAARVLLEDGFVGMIYGDSGVGKTEFARAVKRSIDADGGASVDVIISEVEPAQSPEEPYLALYGRMYARGKPNLTSQFKRALTTNKLTKTLAIIKAGFQDLYHNILGDAEATTAAIADIAEDAATIVPVDKLRRAIQGSNFTKLIDALHQGAKQTGYKFILIIDGYERAPESGFKLLDSLSRQLPNNIGIVLVVNSEDTVFMEHDFAQLRARLQQRYRDNIFELKGLTASDIIEWKRRATGIELTSQQAAQVRQESDGRPFLLRPWIESNSIDLGPLVSETTRFYGYYDQKFAALDSKEKSVCRLLAVSFPHALHLEVLSAASGFDRADVESALDTLHRNGFSEMHINGHRSKHSLISKFLTSKMNFSQINDYMQSLFEAINTPDSPPQTIPAPSRDGALRADMVTGLSGPQGIEFLLRFSGQLMQLGSYRQIEQKLEAIDRLINEGIPVSDHCRADIFLLSAQLANHRGRYQYVTSMPDVSTVLNIPKQVAAKIALSKGEAYFRLNDYPNAVRALKRARKMAQHIGSDAEQAEAIIRLAQIMVDVGKMGTARKIASVMSNRVAPILRSRTDLNPSLCHILRTSARIYALSDIRKAHDQIKEAMDLAYSVGSDRIKGNTLFARGEVLRHAQDIPGAQDCYESAFAIGRDTGNKDLAVYSLLGLAILSLVDTNEAKFIEIVEKLDSEINYEAPAERATADLLLAMMALLQGQHVPEYQWQSLVDRFRALRRNWQIEFIERIRKRADWTTRRLSKEIAALPVVF